jgi:hypothetical protein
LKTVAAYGLAAKQLGGLKGKKMKAPPKDNTITQAFHQLPKGPVLRI